MSQIGLWERSGVERAILRYYQEEAVHAVALAFESHTRVLVEMATGAGKTTVFAEIARLWPGRVLILAHRDELIQQARVRVESHCGESVGVEQGMDFVAGERIVVGSFDTVRQPKRLARMVSYGFTLVIIDEVHHVLAKTYLAVARQLHASGARILGVTATPDRGDKRAMGLFFERVGPADGHGAAYRFGINECVQAGYLVPVHGARVGVESVDLSQVSTVAGDLHQGQLEEAMLRGVEGIVKTVLARWPDRKGICFFPGVKSAEMAAARFNAESPDSAAFVCGETPHDTRRQIMADIKRGKYRYLCNAMIATEGFDWPEASLVVCGRPTKSRALFAQMAGRATRVLPGVVDRIHGEENATVRQLAIAASGKSHCVIADFVGNSGKHSLAGVEDVLGGDYSEPERARAKKILQGQTMDTCQALKQARHELQKAAAAVKSQVKARVETFNPLDVFHTQLPASAMLGPRATEGQAAALVKMGLSEKEAQGMSKQAASRMLSTAAKRRQLGLATYKQLAILKKYGVDAVNVSISRATQALDYIASQGWSASKVDVGRLAQIAGVAKEKASA